MTLRTLTLLAATAMAVLLLAGCDVFTRYVQHEVQDKVQEQISGVSEDATVVQRNDPISLSDPDSFIYVIDQDGTNEARSVQAAENKAGAVLSPDGDKIAFLSGGHLDNSFASAIVDVYVIDVDGTDRTKITANNPFRNVVSTSRGQPVWSPDGKRVAFTSYTEEATDSSSSAEPDIAPAEEVTGIYVANASGFGAPIKLSAFPGDVSPTNLTWSPDGEKIASYDGEALNVIKDDKNGQWDLINHLTSAQPPHSWSPDGKRIAYVAGHDRDIYVHSAEGYGKRRLADTLEPEGYPAWSPDGKRIAFFSGAAAPINSASPSATAAPERKSADLYVINADGSGRRHLAKSVPAPIGPGTSFPAWSSDGKKIAFFCPAPFGMKGRDICVINADGTEWKRLALDVD